MTTRAYTQAQVERYLAHISFPTQQHPIPGPAQTRTSRGLEYLTALQKYQLCAVPFENVSLHYSQTKLLSLDPDDLFEKIVDKKRGGYCMEVNHFFGCMLKSIGFDVVRTGGRVYGPDGVAGGLSHEVNLVLIEEQLYLVDVGFGGPGPTCPVPVKECVEVKAGSTAASHRLITQNHSNNFIQPKWILQNRFSPTDEWRPVYQFTLTEFHTRDFEVMNYFTSTNRHIFFTHKLIGSLKIMDKDTKDIVGAVTLEHDKFKKRINGESEVLRICKNEDDRVDALEKWFGIVLSEKERKAIGRSAAEIGT